jgi:exo-beta-1,3-glucanase (GH17 family)
MQGSEHTSERSLPLDGAPVAQSPYTYRDSPYNINRYSSSNLELGPGINPNELADDDDWGMAEPAQKRRSFNPFHSVSREGTPSSAGNAAVGAAGAGASATALSARDSSGKYNAVPAAETASAERLEKSEWLAQETTRNKRLRWIVGTIIAILVIAAIVGGVLGGILGRKDKDKNTIGGGGSASPENVAQDNKNDLDKNSKEIQALLNNKNLHKVFPGMDYTPLNVQYPECVHAPPSQNNITRDMAVLSQLTNAVRLYGTDCNQTEMVLHAIDRLELTDMKVWLGVWIGDNQTTNDRQLSQLWKIFDDHKADKFKGVIVGNEVLFRKDVTETELATIIKDVKQNLTDRAISIPIATSDLGDNWTADLASEVDIVMSNIHPFFAGVTAEEAAGWTWSFWQNKDVVLTTGASTGKDTKQIISEVGWPSEGGNSCGARSCVGDTEGSVAGIEEMNTFMESWVCESLRNQTMYFWFETFDEPWKVRFNEPGKEWEDKWGLMDVDRKLKKGIRIPDCGGQTPDF